ncbi:hypothetical protein ACQP1W_51335 [Spirillospora sp. CA-255316]
MATFAVGTDAFVMAGLLPAIAADLDVSIPAAGQLVTVFALTLAVAAPVLSWLLSPLDRRKAATDGMASVMQQHRLVTIAPASAPLLFGLNASAIYVGVAIGGVLGGLSQDRLSITLLGVPAAVLALLATTVTLAEGRASNQAKISAVEPEYSR